jgi:hypothetical protein
VSSISNLFIIISHISDRDYLNLEMENMNNKQDLDNTNNQQTKTDNDVVKELEREGKLKKSVMKGGVADEYENEKPRQG